MSSKAEKLYALANECLGAQMGYGIFSVELQARMAELRAALEAALDQKEVTLRQGPVAAYEVRYSDGSFCCLNREQTKVRGLTNVPLYYLALPAQTPVEKS